MPIVGETLPHSADVVIIGAGMVGAACARALAHAGLHVCVVDRVGVAAGSSSAGEGNLLVSDKLPGPELDLALHSIARWRDFAHETGNAFEFTAKGGLVVAATALSHAALERLAVGQQESGVDTVLLAPDELRDAEPLLAPGMHGGVLYPQDAQVQPMLAVRALLEAGSVTVVAGADVLGAARDARGAIIGLRTSKGRIATDRVLIAAGAWSGEVAQRLGGHARVVPRRGHVLVTEALPPLVRHKVYEAGYVDDVESDDGSLLSSPVVEGTESGPILLGSSRELVGFDRRLSTRAIALIARGAAALFPFLRDVRAIRAYLGFRPASPDHLPIIGAEESGLWYATGHEGAGIGLSMGTADLIRALLLGEKPPVDPTPFSPMRERVREIVDA